MSAHRATENAFCVVFVVWIGVAEALARGLVDEQKHPKNAKPDQPNSERILNREKRRKNQRNFRARARAPEKKSRKLFCVKIHIRN
jgi:hypothetical protein